MKALILTLLFVSSLLVANAQQLTFAPQNNLTFSNYFKQDTSINKLHKRARALQLKLDTAQALKSWALKSINADIVNMPVAKLNNTDRNMPIAQTDRTAYTMPVAGKSQPSIYYMQKPKEGVVQKDKQP